MRASSASPTATSSSRLGFLLWHGPHSDASAHASAGSAPARLTALRLAAFHPPSARVNLQLTSKLRWTGPHGERSSVTSSCAIDATAPSRATSMSRGEFESVVA